MESRRIYRPAGPVLARISTYPGGLDLPADLDLHPGADTRSCWPWLARTWQHPELRAAVWLANPELAGKFTAVLAGDPAAKPPEAHVIRRLAIALACYVLRWQHRPTPFGLFAGVTTANSGSAASARFGPGHRVTARPNGTWLAALATELEHDPALRLRLPVVASNAAVIRGDRLVVPGRPADGAEPGPLVEVSVRASGPVRLAMEAAAAPVPFATLAEQVTAAFPAAGAAKVAGLLAGLVESGFLLTALRPPATVVDTLGYLRCQLRAAGGDDTPSVAPVLADLDDIASEFDRHDGARSLADGHAIRVRIAEKMRALAPGTGSVIAADTAVDGQVTLPDAVLEEAARAADVLLRCAAQPFGTAAWTDYHVAFRERYGPGALVPLRDLVADSGLGFPAGFLGAACGRAARPVTDRDAALLALLQEAARDGVCELELTDQAVAAITVGEPDQVVVTDRVELAFELHASSPDDIGEGRFQLWVSGAPQAGSSMAGRFAAQLPEPSRELLAASYLPCAAAGHGGSGGSLAVQLAFPPRRVHNDNVVRVPLLLPALLSLGEYPDPHAKDAHISVADLAVTADATQMYLVHVGTGQLITPCVLHALERGVHTPPLARFLAEITSARHAVYGPFDFGVARTLPHLPRVRCGRTILAPARWTVQAASLPGPAESAAAWDAAFDSWRQGWRVPPHVTVVEGDLRLPVGLDCLTHRAIVRSRLNRAEALELREAPSPSGFKWAGRACEFLLPLTAAAVAAGRVPRVVQATQQAPSWTPPGSGDVLHARLLGHPARYSDILTAHLPGLLNVLGADVLRWWYLRYRNTTRPDSHEHLSIFLRLLSADHHRAVASQLAEVAGRLHRQGMLADLTLQAYQPQPGRYGPDLNGCEEVASADSAAAVAQIAMAARTGIPLEAITAVSMTRIATALAPDLHAGYEWLADRLPRSGPGADRGVRDMALGLAMADAHELRQHYPGAALVDESWQARDRVLAAYRDTLAPSREPLTVLRSLLHEQHVRTMGVGPDQENLTVHLARAAGLRGLSFTRAMP